MQRKPLILTSILLAIIIGVVLSFVDPHPYHKIEINTKDQFTYGDPLAPVHLVLFEEFACPECQRFHKEDLPFLYEEYIQTGKAKLTIIPTAFLEPSTIACLATICVFKEEPGRTKHFIDFLFNLDQNTLLSLSGRDLMAHYAGSIPTDLKENVLNCMKEEAFGVIENNLALVRKFYPGDIQMPTLIINDHLCPNMQRKTFCQMIDNELHKRGT